jgi:hypothetical protein
MGKPTASQRRARGAALHLYAAETTLGWRVVRNTTETEAAEKLAKNRWWKVYDVQGNLLGYQIIADKRSDTEILSKPTACSITMRVCELNAGLDGRSRTLGMPEEKKLNRPPGPNGHIPVPDDAVERAIQKVRQWPHPASRIDDGTGVAVYGDKAVRVYPKPAR